MKHIMRLDFALGDSNGSSIEMALSSDTPRS